MKNTDSKKTSLIVSGASSYLCSRLIPFLKERFHLVCLHRNSTQTANEIFQGTTLLNLDALSLEEIIHCIHKGSMITGTLHAATSYGRNNETPEEISYCNFELPRILLEISKTTNQKFFLNIDTCLPDSLNTYSSTKARFRGFFRNFNTSMLKINIPLQQFYGPFDNQLIWNTIAKCVSGTREIPCSEGYQKRDFIYINDLIDALKLIISNLKEIEGRNTNSTYLEFPVGTGEPVAVREVLSMVARLTGSKTRMLFGKLNKRSGEPEMMSYTSTELRSLGWKPHSSIHEGISEMIMVCKEHQRKISDKNYKSIPLPGA
jgi:CDP-paratose synthetase